MSALSAIYEAVYGVLKADAALEALLAPSIIDGTSAVVNDVPEEQPYPVVQLGSGTERGDHTMGGRTVGIGWNDTITVHIWSQYQGDREALQILNRVVALLNYVDLTISGFRTVVIELEQARVLVEAVKKVETRHIPAVFRVQVTKA